MRSIELFVGAGGLGIGASQAGFTPAAVIDWDKWACNTIRKNAKQGREPFSNWPLFEADIRNFSFGEITGPIDLITGGPPCQPFSMGGRHQAFLDKRDMFPQAIRAVREIKPRAFIFENVKGLNRAAFSIYLEYIRLQLCHPEIKPFIEEPWFTHLSRLEDHDKRGKYVDPCYKVFVGILNAADFGVPQKRERIFIVGFRQDTKIEWKFPEPTHSYDALIWDKWRSGKYWERNSVSTKTLPIKDRGAARAERLKKRPTDKPWITVREAISDLPDPEKEPIFANSFSNHQFQPGARSYPGHTGSPLDEPAKTLKAGVHGVPGGENMLRRNDGSVRYFTIRESARLQTFPDNVVFHGSWTETMRQLGNAVPCELARVLTSNMYDLLYQKTE